MVKLLVSDEVKEKRRSLCDECPSNKLGVCTDCGCVIPIKIQWVSTYCPQNKWGKEEWQS